MSSWEKEREVRQEALVNPLNHLAAVEQWASNALSFAERVDSNQQTTGAIFAQVAIARAIAALASAVLRVADAMEPSARTPTP